MILESIDGIRYDLSDYGIKLLTFHIDSLSPRIHSEAIDGRDGHIDIETNYDGRSIRASFLMESESHLDYYTKRNEVYRLFNTRNYFYLINPKEPNRRWKVKITSRFIPERIGLTEGKLELVFLSPSPFAESVNSTLNPVDEYFQVSTEEHVQYSFAENSFSVWNDGDVMVDPRESELTITFTGASTNLTLRNTTTDDMWSYTGTTINSDVLVLDGIRSYKNDTSIFGQTNRKLIRLNPGWNDFIVEGTTGTFEIAFDFRFKYI
jgi:hypothetical protein